MKASLANTDLFFGVEERLGKQFDLFFGTFENVQSQALSGFGADAGEPLELLN